MPRILLMNQICQEALPLALVQSGYTIAGEVATVCNIPRMVAALQPDVIVINTTSLDHAVLEQLNWVQQNHPCPVVVFSADGSDEKIHDAVRVGVTSYVVNGFSAWRLNAIIHTAIARFKEIHALRHDLAEARKQLVEPDRKRNKFAYQLLGMLAAERQRIQNLAEKTFVIGSTIGFVLGMLTIGIWSFAHF